MKLNNGEIFMAREPLQKLMGEKFPVKVSYNLARLTSKLNEQLRVIEEVRNGLIQTHGEASKDNPQQIAISPDSKNFPKFAQELAELFNQEVEVVFDKVKLPEEVDGKPLQLEPSVFMALEKFIEVG